MARRAWRSCSARRVRGREQRLHHGEAAVLRRDEEGRGIVSRRRVNSRAGPEHYKAVHTRSEMSDLSPAVNEELASRPKYYRDSKQQLECHPGPLAET